jgi:transcriptional regulator with XRE-family HTH domain
MRRVAMIEAYLSRLQRSRRKDAAQPELDVADRRELRVRRFDGRRGERRFNRRVGQGGILVRGLGIEVGKRIGLIAHSRHVVKAAKYTLASCRRPPALGIVRLMSLQRRFAARIREIRRLRGLTQQQLAERINRSTNAISSLERGLSLPTFETLERLADALNAPVREFFDTDAVDPDPKREALPTALKTSARGLSLDDLAFAQSMLDLLAKRESGKRSVRGSG